MLFFPLPADGVNLFPFYQLWFNDLAILLPFFSPSQERNGFIVPFSLSEGI